MTTGTYIIEKWTETMERKKFSKLLPVSILIQLLLLLQSTGHWNSVWDLEPSQEGGTTEGGQHQLIPRFGLAPEPGAKYRQRGTSPLLVSIAYFHHRTWRGKERMQSQKVW